MIRCVVDTNVPVVANGQSEPGEARSPSIVCRLATVSFLQTLLSKGRLVVDLEGQIQAEYRRHLDPSGQPGVGDRFYQVVLHSSPTLVERVSLPSRDDGEFAALPQSVIDADFDPSDRKFAAMAKQEGIPVFNATDTDWLEDAAVLAAEGIDVRNLCGCVASEWFAE